MYDIRQFRPSLYVLLAIGVTGFGLAMQTPGLWLFALAAMALNAWLLKTGRFVPLPRLLATVVTFAALAYTIEEIRDGGTPLIIIGEFLVLLHLVKLYEQRGNRDYAQLLVLSLLLMAAASISTARLLFGVLLIAYLFLALHCCLLLHLKMESDAALASLRQPREKANLASIRQDQRRLSASMRLLTAVISLFSIVMGVIVFMFFPRGAGDVLFGRRAWIPPPAITGFNDEISYQQPTQILSSSEIVARVRVTRDGKPWGGVGPLLLRGTTLDIYTGDGKSDLVDLPDGTIRGRRPDSQDADEVQPWQWRRSRSDGFEFHCQPGADQTLRQFMYGGPATSYIQDITLQPTATSYLFAMAGAFKLTSGQTIGGVFYPRDSVIVTDESTDRGMPLHYVAQSLGFAYVSDDTPVGQRSRIDPMIEAYARQPEVSGADAQGRSLASLRDTPDAPEDIDRLIALAIERHLRTTFQYSVNLPADVREEVKEKLDDSNRDPLVTFLYDAKKGHCEYFAGAMTLLCQSLGMDARMVVGYRCDDFNTMGQFYIVRENQAHAWVEVMTRSGWATFDPTSSNETVTTGPRGWIGQAESLFNYLEYEWGITVIAYGQDNRKDVVDAMNLAVTKTAVSGSQSLLNLKLRQKLNNLENPTLLGWLMTLLILAILAILAYFTYERFRLRLRARRMGLKGLPPGQQDRLARQLAFYADLLRILERRSIVFPDHQTPLEFSGSLSFLPNQAYHDIRRLTEIFYRIRYGHGTMNPHRKRRLAMVISRLDQRLGKPKVNWFA